MSRDAYRTRYRFTLAHEAAHLILHREQIEAVDAESGTDPQTWKRAVKAIPADDYSRMERQAYRFAGHVLVPRGPLFAVYQEAAEVALRNGIDLAELGDASIDYVAGWIARRFDVSTEVISIELRRADLW
jgi:Zn-dependent peptidase ImmA (M78 family)